VRMEELLIDFFRRIVSESGAVDLIAREPVLDGDLPSLGMHLRNGSRLSADQAASLLRGMLRGAPLGSAVELGGSSIRVSAGFDFQLTFDGSNQMCELIKSLVPDGLCVFLEQEFPEVEIQRAIAGEAFWDAVTNLGDTYPSLLVIERFAYGKLGENWFRIRRGETDVIRRGVAPGSYIVAMKYPTFEEFAPRDYFDEISIQAVDRLAVRYFHADAATPNLSIRPLMFRDSLAQPGFWDRQIALVPEDWVPSEDAIVAVMPDRDGVVRARWLA
jgi:hypothetical protein